jgi:hypothetical protein
MFTRRIWFPWDSLSSFFLCLSLHNDFLCLNTKCWFLFYLHFQVYHPIIRLNCVWNVFIAQLHSDGVFTTEPTKQCTRLIIMQFNKFYGIRWNKNCGGIQLTNLKIKSHKIKRTHCTQIDKSCKKIMFSQMYQLLPFKPNKFIYLDGIKCQNTEARRMLMLLVVDK